MRGSYPRNGGTTEAVELPNYLVFLLCIFLHIHLFQCIFALILCHFDSAYNPMSNYYLLKKFHKTKSETSRLFCSISVQQLYRANKLKHQFFDPFWVLQLFTSQIRRSTSKATSRSYVMVSPSASVPSREKREAFNVFV